MRTVLFVCSGNTCRSPMAEAIARDILESGALSVDEGVFFASAGVSAGEGTPTSRETIEALRRRGIELEGRSKPLTRSMIENADLVLCMTRAHVEAARRLVAGQPDQIAKIKMLTPDRDIGDPIGLGQPVYDQLAEELKQRITERLEELFQP